LEVLNTIIGIPLGYILYFCYQLLPSFGPAVLLFTLITKVLLFPLSLWGQKNAITMVKIQPALDDIKQRFAGNNTLIMEEQRKLYKEHHYSVWAGMLPLLIQIPIILGLINVIYNPLQHLLHMDAQMITAMVAQAANQLGVPVAELGFGAQLKVMELVRADPGVFANIPGVDAAIAPITAMQTQFLGVDMVANPALGQLSLIYPVLSGLSALVLCAFQNKYYVLQINQGFAGKWGMAIFLVAFSAYFAAVLPCGVGLYWIAGNLLSIAVLALCNVIYDPHKHIDFSKLPQKPKLSKEQKAAARELKAKLKAREKADGKRFFKIEDKQLVFYSESSGFWKYFERIIAYVLQHSDLTVYYVTSDPDDRIFENNHPQLRAYYIGPKALTSFMMKMDADMVVMTMPDLETFHIKRSLVRKDVEYVYLDHGIGSYHMVLREHALDNFDTVFVYGPHHIAEVRASEELYGLPEKKLVETGFPLMDTLLSSVADVPQTPNDPPIALVAPSWQKDNLMDLCLPEVARPLIAAGFKVIVRPHPQYVRIFADRIQAFEELLADDVAAGRLTFERDFSSNSTVYTADVMVTDWSTIAQEFSFTTKKPALFVNTPMKVMNPNWEDVGLVPLEISQRDELGVSFELDELDRIGDVALEFIEQRAEYRERIAAVLERTLFNIGCADAVAGDYIIDTLAEVKELREQSQLEWQRKLEGLADA